MSSTVFVLLVLLLAPSAIAVGISVAVVIILRELKRRRDPRPGYLIEPARETTQNGYRRDRIHHD